MELLICAGLDRRFAFAVKDDQGGFERVSEHDTPEEACAAKLSAALAAAKALADLAELSAQPMKDAA